MTGGHECRVSYMANNRGAGGEGVLDVMNGRSRVVIDPCTPNTVPGAEHNGFFTYQADIDYVKREAPRGVQRVE